MSDLWLRRIAWGMVFFTLAVLIISAVMLFLASDTSSVNWLWAQVGAIVALGAPVLGLIIVTRQPRNRVGWLWIVYGLVVGISSLGHAIYYIGGSQPAGYSAPEYFLLWLAEAANLATLICLNLLLLWFPDGHLLSSRWRILYAWLFLAVVILSRGLFTAGSNWNGGAEAGGIVIDNPYGFLPDEMPFFIGFAAFISIILIAILSVVSLVMRYRSAGQLVRLQLRWFVLGGFIYVCLNFVPAFFVGNQIESNFTLLLYILNFSAILALYIAVGIAILRYRLYDIDLIIRKTLQYGLLTGLLALVYFGSVVLLQRLFENLTGRESPIVIVISTLMIAALFNPLRRRVQSLIDRRFFRRKYNAEQTLAKFTVVTRDEVDMQVLTAATLAVVEETMQPEKASLWLKPAANSWKMATGIGFQSNRSD